MNLTELNNQILQCRKCPRLVAWREKVSKEKRKSFINHTYWGKPVPGFGDPMARIFIVGLAPGAHGSNRTGRQFTGDSSGDFLFQALYKFGLASQPISISSDDGLSLKDTYTAPVCRCVPPNNKPTLAEITNCQKYLEEEIKIIKPTILVALGRIAFDSIIRLFAMVNKPSCVGNSGNSYAFAHSSKFLLKPNLWLVSSFHPSRQNTQTGRLTPAMFDKVWDLVLQILEDEEPLSNNKQEKLIPDA